MSREGHFESVGFAEAEAEALKNRLIVAGEKQTECMAAVIQAVGDQPATESARMAYEWCASLADRIDELIRIADNIHLELNRYAGGF